MIEEKNKKEKIKLSDLLSDINSLNIVNDCFINELSLNSNLINPGDLFIACKGFQDDGCKYIDKAIILGAAAVIYENENYVVKNKNIPIILVKNLSIKVSSIAAKFYRYPSKELIMIGVTGTNGKTSITQFIARIMTKLGFPCGIIGTLGIGFLNNFYKTINTTPDAISIQKSLRILSNLGAKAVTIELSSHGLSQGRVNDIDFDIGVFTNLTHDHLDYHLTMEDYGNSKKILFLKNNLKYAVINADDEFGLKLINEIKNDVSVHAYTINNKLNIENISYIIASKINLKFPIISAEINTIWGEYLLESKLIGDFNISNLLAVVGVLGIVGFNLKEILLEIKKLTPVIGRMEMLEKLHNFSPQIIIDYAHTPIALEQALLSLRKYYKGILWCIFGCGGDRDKTKRSEMGKIAELHSDKIIITNDNPRNENPEQIVNDILSGITHLNNVIIEYDRIKAINYAINYSSKDDVILLAGKGHENYQIIGKEQIAFSDKIVAYDAIMKKYLQK